MTLNAHISVQSCHFVMLTQLEAALLEVVSLDN